MQEATCQRGRSISETVIRDSNHLSRSSGRNVSHSGDCSSTGQAHHPWTFTAEVSPRGVPTPQNRSISIISNFLQLYRSPSLFEGFVIFDAIPYRYTFSFNMFQFVSVRRGPYTFTHVVFVTDKLFMLAPKRRGAVGYAADGR